MERKEAEAEFKMLWDTVWNFNVLSATQIFRVDRQLKQINTAPHVENGRIFNFILFFIKKKITDKEV